MLVDERDPVGVSPRDAADAVGHGRLGHVGLPSLPAGSDTACISAHVVDRGVAVGRDASWGEPPFLESWYRDRLAAARIDISSSGVAPYTFAHIRAVTGLTHDELDAVLMDDSVSFGAASLREAIAERYAGGQVDRVMATHGSSEAISLILSALVEPGSTVAIIEPTY